jgi:hypothetical protein
MVAESLLLLVPVDPLAAVPAMGVALALAKVWAAA